MGGKYWELYLLLRTNGHSEKEVQSLCSEVALRTAAIVAERAVAFCRGLGDTHHCSPAITDVSPGSRFPMKLSVRG